MSNSKLKVLDQFPTAKAAYSPQGKYWYLDGVHGVLDVQAPDELQLWEEAFKYSKKWPDAQDRYLLKFEYFEAITKTSS